MLQVSVGMGALAGSTVMLLTVVWGGSVLFGRCDIDSKVTAQHGGIFCTQPWHVVVDILHQHQTLLL